MLWLFLSLTVGYNALEELPVLLSSQGIVSVEMLSGRYYHQLEVRCTSSFFTGLFIMLCPVFELSLQKIFYFKMWDCHLVAFEVWHEYQ